MIGIDAPELFQDRYMDGYLRVGQMAGHRELTADVLTVSTDGVLIGRLLVEDADVGLAVLAAGEAWLTDEAFPEREAYEAAFHAARAAKKGIWSDPDPVPPWDFARRRWGLPIDSPEPVTDSSDGNSSVQEADREQGQPASAGRDP